MHHYFFVPFTLLMQHYRKSQIENAIANCVSLMHSMQTITTACPGSACTLAIPHATMPQQQISSSTHMYEQLDDNAAVQTYYWIDRVRKHVKRQRDKYAKKHQVCASVSCHLCHAMYQHLHILLL